MSKKNSTPIHFEPLCTIVLILFFWPTLNNVGEFKHPIFQLERNTKLWRGFNFVSQSTLQKMTTLIEAVISFLIKLPRVAKKNKKVMDLEELKRSGFAILLGQIN